MDGGEARWCGLGGVWWLMIEDGGDSASVVGLGGGVTSRGWAAGLGPEGLGPQRERKEKKKFCFYLILFLEYFCFIRRVVWSFLNFF